MNLPKRDTIGIRGYGPYNPQKPFGVPELYQNLCLDKDLQKQLRQDIDNPEKHDEIWERIEGFKRKYPYLCRASDNESILHWEFVGERRIQILDSTYGKYLYTNTAVRQSLLKYKETVHRLLCRTYGKLSTDTLNDILKKNDYNYFWEALPNDMIYPVHHNSANDIIRSIDVCYQGAEKRCRELPEDLSKLVPSEHDIVVYATGLEFDQSSINACKYMADVIEEILDYSHDEIEPRPFGVLDATTSAAYNEYIAAGGVDIPAIRESILAREEKEIAAPKRPYPNNATYVPIPVPGGITTKMFAIRYGYNKAHAPNYGPEIKIELPREPSQILYWFFAVLIALLWLSSFGT